MMVYFPTSIFNLHSLIHFWRFGAQENFIYKKVVMFGSFVCNWISITDFNFLFPTKRSSFRNDFFFPVFLVFLHTAYHIPAYFFSLFSLTPLSHTAGKSRFGSLLSLGNSLGKTDRLYMKGPGGHGEVEVAVSGVAGNFFFSSFLLSVWSSWLHLGFCFWIVPWTCLLFLISSHMLHKVVSNTDSTCHDIRSKPPRFRSFFTCYVKKRIWDWLNCSQSSSCCICGSKACLCSSFFQHKYRWGDGASQMLLNVNIIALGKHCLRSFV